MPAADQANASQADPPGLTVSVSVSASQHLIIEVLRRPVEFTLCDPVEKKPFFHAYPGALAYSFGMLGCDLHCSYCQNWVTSQALRDPHAVSLPRGTTPEAVVHDAVQQGAQVMVSTYNEPLITSEWAVAIFKEAKAAGLTTGFVSNGNGTPQVLEYLRPWVDLYKVDLKSFDDKQYRKR